MAAQRRGRALAVLLAAGCAACTPPGALAQVDVLTQHNDSSRTGANLRETALSPATVSRQQFGMLYKHTVDDQLYTQPLVATGIRIAGGTHDVVYVTTVNNSVYAFDANDAAAKAPLWHVNFGVPANLNDADFGCLDINGKMGIIGTPVLSADKSTLYVVALTHVGGGFEQRLHALDTSTGADLPHSPALIAAPGFDPLMQNQRPALFLDAGRVYIGYASHCDKEPYHGYLLSYDAQSLTEVGVLNTSPGGEGASIWQSGQAPAVDSDGNIYLVTGNGSWNGTTQFSESFMKLSPEMKLLDWFTPSNHVQLDKQDNDLDSSGATLIPGTKLVLGGGKEGVLYLLDTSRLGHLGDEHAVQHFSVTSSHLHSLVYWKSARHGSLLYSWGQRDKARVYKLDEGKLGETPFMMRDERNEGHPGAMLSLSANGETDGILWASIHASGDSWHESRPGVLHAYDADDISHELWNSLEDRDRDNCGNYAKMAPPTVANGKVYLASFGLENTGTGQLCVYGLLPHGPVPPAPSQVQGRMEGRFASLAWSAVPGVATYTVESTQGGARHVVASGLTSPTYKEPATDKGAVTYDVLAVNENGPSERSTPVLLQIKQTPEPRMAHR